MARRPRLLDLRFCRVGPVIGNASSGEGRRFGTSVARIQRQDCQDATSRRSLKHFGYFVLRTRTSTFYSVLPREFIFVPEITDPFSFSHSFKLLAFAVITWDYCLPATDRLPRFRLTPLQEHNLLTRNLHNGPPAGEIDLVPPKQLLAIRVANGSIDVVVVKNWAEARIREDTPKHEGC